MIPCSSKCPHCAGGDPPPRDPYAFPVELDAECSTSGLSILVFKCRNTRKAWWADTSTMAFALNAPKRPGR